MATNTARAGLRKPGTSDFVTVGTDLNDNMDQLDEHLGYYVCTSATRPTGADRFTGRDIYETDTRQFLMWDGSDWQYTGGFLQGTWTLGITGGTSGSGSVGNGTVSANYLRQGHFVDVWFRFTLGSTTSFAGVVGALLFSLPIATTQANGTAIGSGSIVNAANRYVISCQVEDANRMAMVFTATANAVVSNSSPWSWGNGDLIRFNLRYKVTP